MMLLTMRTFSFILLLFVFAGCRAPQTSISADTYSGRTYYHLLFTLTPHNSSLVVPPAYKDPITRTNDISTFDAGGIFEIFIRASEFPVPSPGCNGGWIILRMPDTSYDDSGLAAKVATKREIWNRLEKMYTSGSGSVEVAIELNPYVRVLDDAIPKVELLYCNVFFRQAFGTYVPYVGPLKLADKTPEPRVIWNPDAVDRDRSSLSR
jgi:hypothetical protein